MDKSKEQLIKELLHGIITESDMDRLMSLIDRSEYRGFIRRIFDINESELLNLSDAASGLLGMMNRYARKKKNSAFKRNILKPGCRDGKKLIIAEGDSWFIERQRSGRSRRTPAVSHFVMEHSQRHIDTGIPGLIY